MKWVKVVEVVVVVAAVADVVVALTVAADAGRVGWVVPRPPVREATASAPTAGTVSPTLSDSLVTKKSAHNAARR